MVKPLERVHKYFGLILDSKFSLISHINEKISISRKSIGILKYLLTLLSVKTLDQIYKMDVRPHFDFCDVIYDIPKSRNHFDSSITLNYLIDSLEKIQYQAALAVTCTRNGSSLNKLYDELGWESLTDRRRARRLIQFYKIKNNYTPIYLKFPIPHPRTHLNSTQLAAIGMAFILIVLQSGIILAQNFEVLHLLAYSKQKFSNLFALQGNRCLASMIQVEQRSFSSFVLD